MGEEMQFLHRDSSFFIPVSSPFSFISKRKRFMQYADILQQMTLWEKARMLTGMSNWETYPFARGEVKSVFCADGPHGLRKQAGAADHLGLNESVKATCFPTASCLANSWDEGLLEEVGKALGQEAANQGVDVLLGPGLNIKRSPLCGRNFEYYSEDPYLAGKLAAGFIRGVESTGTAACPKHFAANSQESNRMYYDAVVDERTLREMYLTGFEIAVKEGKPGAVMSSYNKVNGTYANENPWLLNTVLRQEWGFEGAVITDWGGSNDIAAGVRAGSTLEMPGPVLDSAERLVRAVEKGELTEEEIDCRVGEILAIALRKKPALPPYTLEDHHAVAKKAALEGIVLMKNEGGLLPLNPGVRAAVIGDFAKTPRIQGAGSSLVNPTRVDTPLACYEKAGIKIAGFAQGFCRDGKKDKKLEEEALLLAKRGEVVLLHLGLPETEETEGLDRSTMSLPENQLSLWKKVLEANPNTVAVLTGGAPMELPYAQKTPAIVQGYLYGQAGAAAMSEILTGKANPCGKLGETWPEKLSDVPNAAYYPEKGAHVQYRDSLYVGYRYFDTVKKKVCFPFGHGLCYTDFDYKELIVEEKSVSFTLTNVGQRAGAEVAQLYVRRRSEEVFRPEKELKGFVRVELQPGESKRVTISFDDKTFRYFNVKTGAFEREAGTYGLLIGASSRDIRLEGELYADGTNAPAPYDSVPSVYREGQADKADEEDFAFLLGKPVPAEPEAGEMGWNSPMSHMAECKNPLCRLVGKFLSYKVKTAKKPDLNLLFIYGMPIRSIPKLMVGMVNIEMAEGILTAANGHFFKGLGKLVKGFFHGRRQLKTLRKDA